MCFVIVYTSALTTEKVREILQENLETTIQPKDWGDFSNQERKEKLYRLIPVFFNYRHYFHDAKILTSKMAVDVRLGRKNMDEGKMDSDVLY